MEYWSDSQFGFKNSDFGFKKKLASYTIGLKYFQAAIQIQLD
jgi:hypothetical protein